MASTRPTENGNLPLHTQILRALFVTVSARKTLLEGRTGKGLEDKDYQRHVGRIAECEVVLDTIERFRKADPEDIDSIEEELRREQSRRTKRTT